MFNYKLKPNSMSVAEYKKELELFNGDENLRHQYKSALLREQFLAGKVNRDV